MWYEILPSLGLVYAFITVPSCTAWGVNMLFNNRKSCARRWDSHPWDYMAYLRDRRITGSEYIPQGLEAIPDPK